MLPLARGFFQPILGLRMLTHPGLRRFVLIPLLLNIVVFVAVGWFAATHFDTFMDQWLPSHEWLAFLRWIAWALFAAAYALATFYGFTLLANLIAAPFNSLLAAKIEARITGTAPPEGNESLMATVIPAITGEIGKIFYFLSRAIPLLLLFLVPGLNIVVTAVWILFGFWFLAIEYADYPMANHALSPTEQRAILRRSPLEALAFGAGATLLMLIPLVQFAAMPAAVAGATRLWMDQRSRD